MSVFIPNNNSYVVNVFYGNNESFSGTGSGTVQEINFTSPNLEGGNITDFGTVTLNPNLSIQNITGTGKASFSSITGNTGYFTAMTIANSLTLENVYNTNVSSPELLTINSSGKLGTTGFFTSGGGGGYGFSGAFATLISLTGSTGSFEVLQISDQLNVINPTGILSIMNNYYDIPEFLNISCNPNIIGVNNGSIVIDSNAIPITFQTSITGNCMSGCPIIISNNTENTLTSLGNNIWNYQFYCDGLALIQQLQLPQVYQNQVTSSPQILCIDSNGNLGSTGFMSSLQGVTGSTGSIGATGVMGPAFSGTIDIISSTGSTGVQGVTGYTGYTGQAGFSTNTGCTGSTGPKGDTGSIYYVNGSGLTGVFLEANNNTVVQTLSGGETVNWTNILNNTFGSGLTLTSSNSVFTNTSGITQTYLVTASIRDSGSSISQYALWFAKSDGVYVGLNESVQTISAGVSTNAILTLNNSDYFSVYVYIFQTNGAPQIGGNNTDLTSSLGIWQINNFQGIVSSYTGSTGSISVTNVTVNNDLQVTSLNATGSSNNIYIRTTDPHISGCLWNSSGILMISSG